MQERGWVKSVMQSMATYRTAAFSPSHILNCKIKPSPPSIVLSHSITDRRPSYNSLVFQGTFSAYCQLCKSRMSQISNTGVETMNSVERIIAARLLGPPARFEASKLQVFFMGEEFGVVPNRIVPRTYTLSHCDFTANLTLTISNIIQRDQLNGWYKKDDVVAEWTEINGNLFLNVHCYVSGPNSLTEITAEFRYLIFSKELPLVLEAVLYGDSDLFRERQELMEASVRVYFHSSSKKYNRMECWGPLKDAAKGKGVESINGYLSASKENSNSPKFWASPKSIFQALVTFLL